MPSTKRATENSGPRHRRHQLRSRRSRLRHSGNDDALRSIRLFASRIADAVMEGRGMKESPKSRPTVSRPAAPAATRWAATTRDADARSVETAKRLQPPRRPLARFSEGFSRRPSRGRVSTYNHPTRRRPDGSHGYRKPGEAVARPDRRRHEGAARRRWSRPTASSKKRTPFSGRRPRDRGKKGPTRDERRVDWPLAAAMTFPGHPRRSAVAARAHQLPGSGTRFTRIPSGPRWPGSGPRCTPQSGWNRAMPGP